MRVPKCGCRNHMGTEKQRFKTKDAAISAIVRNHSHTGKSYYFYRCPKFNHIFHIGVERGTR